MLLDVLADRLLTIADRRCCCGEPDRMALAVDGGAAPQPGPASASSSRGSPGSPRTPTRPRDRGDADPYAATNNAQQLLRALYLQLALGPQPPADRADLILVTVDALRATNPFTLAR